MNKTSQITPFWQSVRQFLFKPSSVVTEIGERRQAELVAWVSLIQTVWFLTATVTIVVRGKQSGTTLVLFAIACISLFAYALSRTRRFAFAARLLVVILSAAGYALLLITASVDGRATFLAILALTFVIASATLSVYNLSVVVLINFVLSLAVPVLLPSFNQISYYTTVSNAAVIGVLLAVFSGLRNSVERERLAELQTANLQLQTIQNDLEQIVRERTSLAETARAQAEAARQEAESARQDMEAQIWLATGQTQLAEVMRGEQGIEALAENVISQICRYIGAHAGALYLLHGKTLTLEGHYALVERPGFDGKFQIGEGLVGQAVADGKVIYWNDIPTDAVLISTGLVDITPRQVAAAPFYANGEVVGALELATLSKFTETHLELWNRISESVGVAFRTVQTRQKLTDLLQETQQQAEELQAQEEELRSINEELQAQAESLAAAQRKTARRIRV